MSITSISRDWGVDPSIVRITTTDNLATITASGYITSQEDAIALLNNGEFTWVEGDMILINYSNGEGFFTRNATTNTFVAETIPGSLSETLPDGDIFVGSAANIATGVTMSGDATMANTGALTIANDAITSVKIDDDAVTTAKILDANVTLSKLAAGIAPAGIIKFIGQSTTVGGAAAEAITVTGAVAATDRAFVQMVDDGPNDVTIVNAVVTADTLTVTFSADPGAGAIINWQLIRAAS